MKSGFADFVLPFFRESAVGNPESANGKRQTTREI
jgi:hypothetical protein